jgi:alkylated DNA repair dioxygenase AlkB
MARVDLFQNPDLNLLPRDGTVTYHGPILGEAKARDHLEGLQAEVPWQRDEMVIFGKRIVTSREVAWFGDPGLAYTYSGTTKQPIPWSERLLQLKALVEQRSGTVFNSCLVNFYHKGEEGMGWHSDDEKSIVRDSAIASLSLGAERRFDFRHKETREKVEVILENGSLLVMQGETQRHWQHQLPPTKKVSAARINLTFRRMVR